MSKICLFGHGLIGQTIQTYLQDLDYEVSVFDKKFAKVNRNYPDLDSFDTLVELITGHDAVIAATPYNVNLFIANAALSAGVSYFDLTEDIEVANNITKLNGKKKNVIFVPQCGLAPGAIGIIANNLMGIFDEIDEVKMRVGALPITTTNHIKYYLSWSSEGLVNEYYKPCPAIVDRKLVMLQPLEGLETLLLDGVEYEAFNTSGGAGNLSYRLINSFGKNISKLTYKTIRHKGHRDQILFLKEDLGLSQEKVVELFDNHIPHNDDDVVLIFVEVTGKCNGKLRRQTYYKKIYGEVGVSAIQKTTAAGIVSVIDCYLNGKMHENNIISFEDFVSNGCGEIYELPFKVL